MRFNRSSKPMGVVASPPLITRRAASGVIIVTVSATIYHLALGEHSSAAITLVLFAMVRAVAYMRYRVLPVTARRASSGRLQ